MSPIGFTTPLSSGQINQAGGVPSQNTVGNAGDKTVQENQSPETGNAITGNNTQTTMTSACTTKPRSISKPSDNVIKGFNHIKGFFQAFKDTVSANTQTTSGVENANKTEEKSLIDKFKEFSSKISQKLDTLIAKAKEGKDEIKAKMLGYDKAINEKFGDALNTKLFTFKEKKALVNFITLSSIETEKDLGDVIRYETNALRNALLKVLPEK